MSGGFNQLGGPYQFINQSAVTNAMASGQDIDWAQLAQQWIQMRDNATTSKDTNTDRPLDVCEKKHDHSAFNRRYEEEGEADMDMDDEEQLDQKDNVDKTRKETKTSIMQQRNAQWFGGDKKACAVDPALEPNSHRSNQWSQWSNNPVTSPSSCQSNLTSRPINPTAHIPSLLKINVPHPNEIRALPDIPDSSCEPNSSSNLMDAAKRKGLPAWIREGLEKMEREKQKQQEKYTTKDHGDVFDDGAPMSSVKANSFNIKQLDNDHVRTESTVAVEVKHGSQTIVSHAEISDEEVDAAEKGTKSYEQKLAELMVIVRHALTELLLEVTNEEISKIANETVKCFKLKGLAAYGDSSSDEYSDDGDNEDSSKKKTFPSESGNDSEEDIKNAVRLKRRSFLKIANEIEERVSAAAVREEEKLKYFLRKEEAESCIRKCKRPEKDYGLDNKEMVTNESVSAHLSSGCSDKIIGKNFERDSGETTETKLQIINGKRQRDRGALKERISRFSDNRDNRYLAIAATASCITDTQAKGIISNTTPPQPATNQNQAAYNINSLLPSYNYLGIANALKSTETDVEAVSKHKALSSTENENEQREREKGYKRNRQQGESKVSPPRSLSSSSSNSSSSSSTTSESSTSGSSNSSKYSHRSVSKHSSQISKKLSRSHKDKYDDRKYYSSYEKKSRDSSYRRYHHDRSRSRSSHRRRGSIDSDDAYSGRKHSRSHTSKGHSHDSRSNSRSSYSSSSKRRH